MTRRPTFLPTFWPPVASRHLVAISPGRDLSKPANVLRKRASTAREARRHDACSLFSLFFGFTMLRIDRREPHRLHAGGVERSDREHVAGIEDLTLAMATYEAACKLARW